MNQLLSKYEQHKPRANSHLKEGPRTKHDISYLEDYMLGKDVVDRRGKYCGIACAIQKGLRGSLVCEVEFRSLLGLHKIRHVPIKYFENVEDSVLKLTITIGEFKRLTWLAPESMQWTYGIYPNLSENYVENNKPRKLVNF